MIKVTTTSRMGRYFNIIKSTEYADDVTPRSWWTSFERAGVVKGDMRVIGGVEYVAVEVRRRWFRATAVRWALKEYECTKKKCA